jgi:hypothetical protein
MADFGAALVTVNVEVPVPVIEAGLKLHLASEGKPEQLSVTALLNPSSADIDNDILPEPPGGETSITLLNSVKAKSG